MDLFHTVFVSYTALDDGVLAPLSEGLEKRGISAWIFRFHDDGTRPWREAVRDEIGRASAVLVIGTQSWLRSEACGLERDMADEAGKKRYVAVLDAAALDDLTADVTMHVLSATCELDPSLDALAMSVIQLR